MLTPRTGIRDIEMVTVFLRGKVRARLSGDPVPEDGLLTLEFTGLVVGIDPVGDLLRVASLETGHEQSTYH